MLEQMVLDNQNLIRLGDVVQASCVIENRQVVPVKASARCQVSETTGAR